MMMFMSLMPVAPAAQVGWYGGTEEIVEVMVTSWWGVKVASGKGVSSRWMSEHRLVELD